MADMTASNEAEIPVDTTLCDREPIHLPGAVQPHATVLVIDELKLIIRQASANVTQTLGIPLTEILGSELSAWLTASDWERIRAAAADKDLHASPRYLPAMKVGHSALAFEVLIHRYKGTLILELESWPETLSDSDEQLLSTLNKMLAVDSSSETVAVFCQRAAEDIQRFIGFDRVMVYRFDPDLSGHVIAEVKRPDLESYLGLRYPASDVPKQARELFRLSRLRLIPDLGYTPVPIEPALRPDNGEPLDMSFCVTRSVSPIHVEYLQNMGVQASMSISVVINKQLWGLFACHHYSPRYVSHPLRIACDFLAHALSVLVAGHEQAEDFAYRKSLHESQVLLTHAIGTVGDFGKAVDGLPGSSIGGIIADGAALVSNGIVCLKGSTPSEHQVQALVQFVAASEQTQVWSSDRIPESMPEIAALIPGVSGLLVSRLSRENKGYLFWFRRELLQHVKWAGDPRKAVTEGLVSQRLSPRKSFALWREEIRARSRPWLQSEITAAEVIRHSYHKLYAGQTQSLIVLNAEAILARDQAVQAMQAKDRFIAALSHELRTPLNPVLLVASEEAENTKLPLKIRETFAGIRDNIALEARLIDDLLDLSRISHGKIVLDRQPIGLHAALKQAIAILKSEFTAKDVTLVLDIPNEEIVANADVVRLLQVFWNVLKNAIKFTPAQGTVTVVSNVDQARKRATVHISDTGIGIRPAELLTIFEAFAQGEHASKGSQQHFGGLGLGLAISRSLLHAHGGHIAVTSEGVGKGTTFTIELPLSAENLELIPMVPPRPASRSPLDRAAGLGTKGTTIRILLVEDHAATRAGMTKMLERRGYTVDQAGSVEVGLGLARTQQFDLVISDIGLPDGDGYGFISELRKLHPAVRVIALSGYGMEDDRTRATNAGFSELLVKPVTIQKLETAISRVLGTSL